MVLRGGGGWISRHEQSVKSLCRKSTANQMPISRDHENISEHYLLVNFIAMQPMSTDEIDVKINPSMLTSMKILLAQRTNLT